MGDESERKEGSLSVSYSRLEKDISDRLLALSLEKGLELTQEDLRNYSRRAVRIMSSDVNSSVYAGLVFVGIELALKIAAEDYNLNE